jgi:hypothetical protein
MTVFDIRWTCLIDVLMTYEVLGGPVYDRTVVCIAPLLIPLVKAALFSPHHGQKFASISAASHAAAQRSHARLRALDSMFTTSPVLTSGRSCTKLVSDHTRSHDPMRSIPS